jgi:squalene-associated FAD-dependent desaturase
MACCTNLADFCERVGTRQLLRADRVLNFLSPEGRISRLQAGTLPAPFHLAGSFLRANYLSWPERIRVAFGMACLRFQGSIRDGEPFTQWLLRHGQNVRTITRFWATVLVSALNEHLEQMDTHHARKVFVDGFLRNRNGYVIEIPVVPLGELYGTRLEGWLAEHHVDVRLTTGVRSIVVDEADSAIEGVILRSGECVTADFVVLAVPFDRVLGLIPESLRSSLPSLDTAGDFSASPITGVHLWFDRPVCPFAHVVTVGRLVQWVFNHTALQGRESPEGGGEYLQIVISASYDLLSLDKDTIRDAVLADLREMWPEVREAKLVRWWVVTEHGATFAVRPGVDRLRPPARTGVDGLFLAGDWTATGWPATMEGAVRSGYRAAEEILEDLASPQRLIKSDLPSGLLARLLLGPNPSHHAAGLPLAAVSPNLSNAASASKVSAS